MVSSKPGWYKDPQNPNNARYWDGYKWSNHVRDMSPKPEKDPEAEPKTVATPAIAFPFQPKGMVVGESTTDPTETVKAFRPQSYDEKNTGPGLFATPEETPADYSRARRGGKNKQQFKKIVTTTVLSLGGGLLVGLVVGAVTVPVFESSRSIQILVVPQPSESGSPVAPAATP